MKKAILGLVFMMAASSAWAGEGPLTCWYSATGESAGADSGDSGIPEADYGKVVPMSYEPYAMVITDWVDGTSCPAKVDIPG